MNSIAVLYITLLYYKIMRSFFTWIFFLYFIAIIIGSLFKNDFSVTLIYILFLVLYFLFFKETLLKAARNTGSEERRQPYLLKKISELEKIDLHKKPYKLLKENKHGHRCYLEGLTYSEREVVDILANSLDSKKYFIFNNLILPTQDGYSTQIDHLVVSPYGVFVIESKDIRGYIFGTYNQPEWTVSTYGKKYKLKNPLWQNFGHIKSLATYIPFIPEEYLLSIVTFSGSGSIKTDLPKNVICSNDLGDYIKNNSKVVLSETDMMSAIGKISYLCQVIDITSEEHVKNIQAKFNMPV